jgi:hypothetical protein
MHSTLRNRSWMEGRSWSAPLTKGIGWGFLGGLASTLVMDGLLIGALLAFRQSAWMCFSIVGDTVSRFLALFGAQVAGGIPTGVAAHYTIGPLVGMLFGAGVTMVPALRQGSLKKIVLASFVYVTLLSQPLLAATPILLKMETPATLQWYGGSFVMHLILSIVLGVIVGCGLRQETASPSKSVRIHAVRRS